MTKSPRRSTTAARRARAPRRARADEKGDAPRGRGTEVHGKERYDILVEAAKIVAALRVPRTNTVPFERLMFQRSVVARRCDRQARWMRGLPGDGCDNSGQAAVCACEARLEHGRSHRPLARGGARR